MTTPPLHPGMMVFDHHVSRVISACRAGIVAVFVLWVVIDTQAPLRQWPGAMIGLFGYFAYSLAVLAINFNNWWLDFLLQRITLAIDCVLFFFHVWFVLTKHTSVVTPLMGFYCFIVLSSAYRWRWKIAFGVAVFLAMGYLLFSAFAVHLEGHGEHFIEVARSGVYMFVLSSVLVWFTGRRQGSDVQKLTITPDAASPIDQALRFAINQSGATNAAMCWSSEDEPYRRVHRMGNGGGSIIALGPGMLEDPASDDTLIFERARHHALRIGEDGKFTIGQADVPPPLAELLCIDQGIFVPLRGLTGSGQLLLCGISAMTSYDGLRARTIGEELSRAFDQDELASLSRDTALMRVRAALARDLHDSVAQTLAGARFRLQSIRDGMTSGNARNAEEEIVAIEDALREEQVLLRDMISRLWRGEVTPGTRNLGPELGVLVDSLSRRWQVKGEVLEPEEPVIVPTVLVYEMQQLVREGFANAVRHGRATQVAIAFSRQGNRCELSITDNGSGFIDPASKRPRSMSERVTSFGGTLEVFSQTGETRIKLVLPVKGQV